MSSIQPPYDLNKTPENANPFDSFGHPGKFHKSILATGNVWFTGSNFGAGAVITSGSATGTIYLSNGGTINAAILATGQIHEFSVEHVENAANLYVLIRNQLIR